MAAGETFKEMRDSDPLLFEAEQAILMLKAAMKYTEAALARCDHAVVRDEIEHAVAAIDLAQGRLGNAQGCQVKRIHEEDPEDW